MIAESLKQSYSDNNLVLWHQNRHRHVPNRVSVRMGKTDATVTHQRRSEAMTT